MNFHIKMFLFFAFSFLSLLLFIYLRECNQFWKKRGVPSTSPGLLFGDIGKALFCIKPAYRIYEDIYNAFPEERYIGFYEFLQPILLVKDPKLIESVLVRDFSHFSEHVWMNGKNSVEKNLTFIFSRDGKFVRSKLTTLFTTNKLKVMCEMINQVADTLDSVLSEKCQYEAVEMKNILARYSVDMITTCYFGLNTNALMQPESDLLKFFESIMDCSLFNLWSHFLREDIPDLYYWIISKLPTPGFMKSFDDLIKKNEELRRSGSARAKNLIQLMLDLKDLSEQKTLAGKNTDDVIIDDTAVKMGMIIGFAGTFEGAANILTFCMYELAVNPDIQQRVRNEVQSVLKANQGVLTYDSLKKLPYTEMVVFETMRKNASLPVIQRACTAPYKVPDSDLTLNVGQLVGIPVREIHFNEKYYPNPNKFDPDRFTAENIASRPPYTFLPFAEGPRICPGMRFGKMHLKLMVARIISKFEICTCSKTEIPLIWDIKSPFTFPKNPIQLRIKKVEYHEVQ